MEVYGYNIAQFIIPKMSSKVSMAKRTYHLADMHCPSCAMRVESIEDELAGVLKATASYLKQQVTVEYDETQVTEEDIVAALKKLGYPASPL